LRDGAEKIKLFDKELHVKARVEVMDSYSAHGDYSEMIDYLKCQEPHLIKHLFLVHGQYDRQVTYREHLTNSGFHHIEIPEDGSTHEF
jgi:metallo-beta-lactamase family protein